MAAKSARYLLAAAAVGVLAGCSADELAFSDVCSAEDDSKVAAVGYFELPSAVVCSIHNSEEGSDTRCNMDFVDEPGAEYGNPEHQFALYVREGNGDSAIEVTGPGYEESDVTIRFDDGSVVEWGDKVQITGWVKTLYGGCSFDVGKIEPAG